MKPFVASFLALLLLAGHAWAQGAAAELIKEKAIRQRDLNNQQQGAISAAASAPSAPGSASAPQGGVSSDQQQLINRLQADLSAIKPGAPVGEAQKQQLQNDIAALTRSTSKPSKAHVTKLSDDLSAALAGNNISVHDPAQLAKDINIVMNSGSSSVSTTQAQSFVTATESILKSGGVGPTETGSVTTDLKTIVAELKQTKAKLYQ